MDDAGKRVFIGKIDLLMCVGSNTIFQTYGKLFTAPKGISNGNRRPLLFFS
jgi:hypothetical protein